MPIYEYRCNKCGEVFEVFQKINDEPVSRCRFCQGSVEKLISHSSFQLKGSGWYLTDYARKSQPSNSSSSKSSDTAAASSSTESSAKPSPSTTPSKTSD